MFTAPSKPDIDSVKHFFVYKYFQYSRAQNCVVWKRFNPFPNDKFKTPPNSKCLQTRILNSMKFNPFQNKPWFFTCLQYKSFENTVGIGEIARNEQFLLFPQCFLPIWRTFHNFHQTQNCRLQSL